MSLLLKDRNLFTQLVHFGISGNIIHALIIPHVSTDIIILLGILVPFPFVMLLSANKFFKNLKFKDEAASSKSTIWGGNLVIYFIFCVGIVALVSTSIYLQDRFFTFDYQGIFMLIMNIIYFGALFFLLSKKIDCK